MEWGKRVREQCNPGRESERKFSLALVTVNEGD